MESKRSHVSHSNIPIIDLHAISTQLNETSDLNGAKLEEISKAIHSAFAKSGFLILKNHGVDLSTLYQLRESGWNFFTKTTAADKNACAYRAPVPRGYSASRKENFAILAGHQKPNDLVEKYRMGPWQFDTNNEYYHASKHAQMMFYPNKWPQNDQFRLQHAMEEVYTAFTQLSLHLCKIFEVCLSRPNGYFTSKLDKHTSILSVNHYPPVLKQVQKEQLRLAEHTDVDLFTILVPDWSDEHSCLEVKLPDEAISYLPVGSSPWQSVPILPETIIVNVGDCLQHWTNARWKSTMHRVIIPRSKEARQKGRISIGFFVGANYDAEIEPFVEDDQDGNQNPMTTYVEWRIDRIRQAIANLPGKQSAIKGDVKHG